MNVTESIAEKPRILWLDLLRGVGISLVVVGHCLSSGVLRTWIYSFHVPLLFMLSGYLNQLLHKGARRFRPRRVLMPYMIWAVLSAGFALLFNSDRSLAWNVRSLFWVGNDVVPLIGFSSWNSAIWFLYALVFIDILKPKWNKISGYVPLVCFLVISVSTCRLYPKISNAFVWKNILFGCLCYGIGESIARFSIVEKLSASNAMPIMLLLIGSLIGLYNGPLSTYECRYGRSAALLFIASTMISVALMILFRRYERKLPVVLGVLGKSSLFIMVSHYFLLRACSMIIPGSLPLDNGCIQVAKGIAILGTYLIYFKLLKWFKVNNQLPDYLGGYVP